MIENVLFFVAGAAAAGLLALLVMPAIAARAVRLHRLHVEMKLPRTLAEVAAAKDAVRAEMAARAARTEVELARTSDRLVAARLAREEMRVELEAVRAERKGLVAATVDLENRLRDAQAELRQQREELARSLAVGRELERRLASRDREVEYHLNEAEAREDEMRRALEDADARIAALSDEVRDFNRRRDDAADPLAAAANAGGQARAPAFPASGSDEERMATLAQRLKVLRDRGVTVSGERTPPVGGEHPEGASG